jgi:hypothetical protein
MKFWLELGLLKNPAIELVFELETELFGSITRTIKIIAQVIVNHILSTIVIA